jgi:hypothetical protein
MTKLIYNTRALFIHSSNHSSIVIQPYVGSWPLLQSRNLFYTDCRTPWTCDQPVARPLHAHITTQTVNKRKHRHPCLEWDSNPWSQGSSERRHFIPALDRTAAVIDHNLIFTLIIQFIVTFRSISSVVTRYKLLLASDIRSHFPPPDVNVLSLYSSRSVSANLYLDSSQPPHHHETHSASRNYLV